MTPRMAFRAARANQMRKLHRNEQRCISREIWYRTHPNGEEWDGSMVPKQEITAYQKSPGHWWVSRPRVKIRDWDKFFADQQVAAQDFQFNILERPATGWHIGSP